MPKEFSSQDFNPLIKGLIEAYLSTSFNVFDPELTIKIGQKNQLLDDLHQRHHCHTWTYITAWNPLSEAQSNEINQFKNNELKQDLQHYIVFDGEGIGQDPTWKPEKSFLVLGINKEEAIALGNKYRQHAIVYGEINKAPELLWLS
jgi:hypothetical protein